MNPAAKSFVGSSWVNACMASKILTPALVHRLPSDSGDNKSNQGSEWAPNRKCHYKSKAYPWH
jgi:hypothetical protein